MKKSLLLGVGLVLIAVALTGCFKNQPPIAKISVNQTQGVAPFTVQFSADKSSDPDGKIVDYSWDFGDGQTSSGVTASHTFRTPGPYKVVLTVTDDRKAKTTDDITIMVIQNIPPVANIIATPIQGVAPLTVDFDGSKSVDADGSIVNYAWDFGDGSAPEEGAEVDTTSHIYDKAGTFTAKLTVRDNNGAENTKTATITVAQKPIVTTLTDKAENDQLLLERSYPNLVEVGKEFTVTVKVTAKVELAGLLLNEDPNDSPLPKGLQVVKGDVKGFKLHVAQGDTLTITYTLKATDSGELDISGLASGITPDGTTIKLPLVTKLQVKPASAPQ